MSATQKKVNNRQQIVAYLGSNRGQLRTQFHVRKIALIGSFARDEQTADSDIDLLIDLEEGTADIYLLKRNLKEKLEHEFGRSVELASERYLKSYYRKQILQEAIYV
jgi:predicted nucleotidyltransferase